MPWSALQSALGEDGAELSYAMVARACDIGLEERTDLDWKSRLPLTSTDADGKQRDQSELAKDIAAFANSGGGLIVYGVAEVADPATTAADHIEPVGPVFEGSLLQIRQVAGNLIYPPVVGLEFSRLAPSDDPSLGVLALHVPGSPDAPHLVHPTGRNSEYFMAPWRDGAHTSRMKER